MSIRIGIQQAQQALRGWTFHSTCQYVSGKKFLAALNLTDDLELQATWAMAHVIAKEFAGNNNWSGSGPATPDDIKRYHDLAAQVLAVQLNGNAK